MPYLLITKQTVSKPGPSQSSQYKPGQLVQYKPGQKLPADELQLISQHYLLINAKAKPQYFFAGHCTPIGEISFVQLDVPFANQLDNANNPTGSCNVTSMAMCLRWAGAPANWQGQQLEDWLYNWLDANGYNRHKPQHICEAYNKVAKLLKLATSDQFTPSGTWNQLLAHLANGKPAIFHWSPTESGHISVAIGYDLAKQELIVHDPYGNFADQKYSPTEAIDSGRACRLPISLLKKLDCQDGDFWLHFIS